MALLAKAGVLHVVDERRVRGAVERTYTMRLDAARVGPEDAAVMTADEHRQAFMAFTARLLADFDRYLDSGPPDMARDGAGYGVNAMWLTDAEFTEFVQDLAKVMQPRIANTPGKGRRRRIVATVSLPSPNRESPADLAQ